MEKQFQFQIDPETILANLPAHVYWLDRNNIFLGCNDEQAVALGLKSRNEIIGRSVYDLAPPEIAAAIIKVNNQIIENGIPQTVEESFPVEDGSIHIYLSHKVPLVNQNNEIVGLAGISFDITTYKQQLSEYSFAKKQTELTLQQIIDALPGNVYWKDLNMRVLGCNKKQAEMLNFSSPNDLIGKDNYDLLPPEAAEACQQNDLLVIQNRQEQAFEEINNKNIPYLSRKAPLFDENNNVIGLIGFSFDISDQKKARSLQVEKESVEKTALNLKMLAGSIAHELRTPLATIGINLDLLQRCINSLHAKLLYQPQTNELFESQKYAKNIKYSITAANHVINMLLLKLQKSADGKITTVYNRHYSIKANIKEALNEYPFVTNEIKLVNFDDSKDFLYTGDQIFTKHVVFNLLKNSIHFIKEAGKGNITISLDTPAQGDFNYMYFTDTATGISTEYLPKLFKQFESNQTNGSGLGLAFCKIIMQSYGGDITCTTKQGEFTKFTLSFPKIKNQ
ncbi:MAG: PAS domain-containing protein [Gammaproteobacteria bacterium]|nr:PAS domain-containing protein [Gammaproteobacteria bacterium]